MTTATTGRVARTMLNRVPEVTIFFWIIKILATTVGETDVLGISAPAGPTAFEQMKRLREWANVRAPLVTASAKTAALSAPNQSAAAPTGVSVTSGWRATGPGSIPSKIT